jgi:2-amino-4-ketopentanoate thiolase alpha subunit
MAKILKGTWVEIEQVILTPEQRASTLPEETKKVPYMMHISGFLQKDAELGEHVEIHSVIGRSHSGKLITVNPSYSHSFGKTVPELLTIGTEAEHDR